MQHHAADQLNVEVPHVQHAASGLANHSKGLLQNFVENFLQSFVLLFFKLFLLIEIGLFPTPSGGAAGRRFLCDPAQPLLNALPEFVRLGAQFGVGELLDLRAQER